MFLSACRKIVLKLEKSKKQDLTPFLLTFFILGRLIR
jgi:hypothetical protein